MNGRFVTSELDQSWRCDRFYVQKIPYLWYGGNGRSHSEHSYHDTGRGDDAHLGQPCVPVADGVVGGVFARGAKRRKYALCELETRASFGVGSDPAKSACRVQHWQKGCAGVPAGLIRGDQSPARVGEKDDAGDTDAGVPDQPAGDRNGSAVDRQRCPRFFQKMEWNLLGEYLSPTDWWSVRLTQRGMTARAWTWRVIWSHVGPSYGVGGYAACRCMQTLLRTRRSDHACLLLSMRARLLRVAFFVLQRQYGTAYCHELFAECNRRTKNSWSYNLVLLRMLTRMRRSVRVSESVEPYIYSSIV